MSLNWVNADKAEEYQLGMQKQKEVDDDGSQTDAESDGHGNR